MLVLFSLKENEFEQIKYISHEYALTIETDVRLKNSQCCLLRLTANILITFFFKQKIMCYIMCYYKVEKRCKKYGRLITWQRIKPALKYLIYSMCTMPVLYLSDTGTHGGTPRPSQRACPREGVSRWAVRGRGYWTPPQVSTYCFSSRGSSWPGSSPSPTLHCLLQVLLHILYKLS